MQTAILSMTFFFQEDSDAWDDTAWIEAYDAAVAPLKVKFVFHD